VDTRRRADEDGRVTGREIVLAASRPLDALAAEIRDEVDAAEADFQSAVGHAIRAGELLIEAKAQVKHGEWHDWLGEHFPASVRTAQGYMRLVKHQANAQRVAHLGIGAALRELADTNERDQQDRINDVLASLSPMDRLFLGHSNILHDEDAVGVVWRQCDSLGAFPLVARMPDGDSIPWVWAGYVASDRRHPGPGPAFAADQAPDWTCWEDHDITVVCHPGWADFCHFRLGDDVWWWPLAEPIVQQSKAAPPAVDAAPVVGSEADAAVRDLLETFTAGELRAALDREAPAG
jgi:hypothetical protein